MFNKIHWNNYLQGFIMIKNHSVKLTITNKSNFPLRYEASHFEYGMLSEGKEWPVEILGEGGKFSVECYETPSSLAGCSGWVKFSTGTAESPISLYFTFSNPVLANNAVDVGISEEVFTNMESQESRQQRVFPINSAKGQYRVVCATSTPGDINEANWLIEDVDIQTVIPANPVLLDAVKTFNGINPYGLHTFYQSSKFGFGDWSVYSHFKGVAAFKKKLIFTHTNILPNLNPFSSSDGIYMIANQEHTAKAVGRVRASYYTDHNPDWGHPGGVQSCGSYMAMSLQKTDSDNACSEIQIYDIRATAINKKMKLITTIEKSGDVNGAGMTKELGHDGRYVVIAGDNGGLHVYRSADNTVESKFSEVEYIKDENGNLPDGFHCGGSGFGLATQADGKLFIFTMHKGNENDIGLYQLVIHSDTHASVEIVEGAATRALYTHNNSDAAAPLTYRAHISSRLNEQEEAQATDPINYLTTSFRWGKGINITSPSHIEIFATDRNVLPNPGLVPIPTINFGMMTWQGSNITEISWGQSNSYDTGSNLAIAMDDYGNCVEFHRGSENKSSNNQLFIRVGKANFSTQKIKFGHCDKYHSGSDLAIAMDNHKHCIEVHRGSGDSNNHYYAVGKIDFNKQKIDMGTSHQYDTGSNLAIAMDDHGNCVEVHRSSGTSSQLYYRVGKVDFIKQEIDWGNAVHDDEHGSDLALAMDNQGNCIELCRGVDGSADSHNHYYRVGKINPHTKLIQWGQFHNYDTGSVVAIAMHNNGNCVELHRGSGNSNTLFYHAGVVDFSEKTIKWSNSHHLNTDGSDIAVAMDNQGHCISLHRGSGSSNKHYYMLGQFFG